MNSNYISFNFVNMITVALMVAIVHLVVSTASGFVASKVAGK